LQKCDPYFILLQFYNQLADFYFLQRCRPFPAFSFAQLDEFKSGKSAEALLPLKQISLESFNGAASLISYGSIALKHAQFCKTTKSMPVLLFNSHSNNRPATLLLPVLYSPAWCILP